MWKMISRRVPLGTGFFCYITNETMSVWLGWEPLRKYVQVFAELQVTSKHGDLCILDSERKLSMHVKR